MSAIRFPDFLGAGAAAHACFAGGDALPGGEEFDTRSPIDGALLCQVTGAGPEAVEQACSRAAELFRSLREIPAPRRGDAVRRIGNEVRRRKEDLAGLVTLETGKTPSEALGEVQEWIDICDFAAGLSRQLYGRTIPSERPAHRMMEQWHPLGPVGVITAFNFPVAVWAWNAMLALVCGNPVLWKPSEKTPLVSLAAHSLVTDLLAEDAEIPPGIFSLLAGGRGPGEALAASPLLPLISATGSVAMGKSVARVVAGRLGRSLLELGGNNAAIVSAQADLELALRSVVFAAWGTCGQRCTTLRRLILHESIAEKFLGRLLPLMEKLPAGDPRQPGVLIGPLIDEAAFEAMQQALATARGEGGRVHGGGRILDGVPPGGFYVRPALVEIDPSSPLVQQETFAPVLYIHRYSSLDEAISIQNGVPQGLSSALFSESLTEGERFLSASGSDCGIANVNIGTSGAEIGGAFGGEKETGGGRESGSDSWKAYMRRATSTINYSGRLPLAQGVEFDID